MPSLLVRENNAESVIKLENVSVWYRAPEERIGTFKEYAIRTLKRQIQFKEFNALNSVSLDVQRGEIFGIIGRNGAGKSTLLKVISRVLIPKAGRVWINGRVAPLLELGAGFHPELTGRENVFVNGTLLGHSHAEIQERLPAILDFAELNEFIDAPLRTYSSGMIARLGFSVATAWIPDILIVDEVLGVGDYAFQQKCQARMEEFRNSGATILLVTHDTNSVQRLCDRVVWLERGAVKALGKTEDIIDSYLYGSSFENWYTFGATHAPVEVGPELESANIKICAGENLCQVLSLPQNAIIVAGYPDADKVICVKQNREVPFYAARHWVTKNYFSQGMGVPASRFSTRYWFSAYDSISMTSTIVVNNPDPSETVDIEVWCSGDKKGQQQIVPGAFARFQFPGQRYGAVSLSSRNGVPFFASQQILYGDSLIDVPGVANHELASEVWFPWYNSRTVRSWLEVANPDLANPIRISARLNNNLLGEYQVLPGQVINLSYPDVIAGPLHLICQDGRPLIASHRIIRGNTLSDMPGFTIDQASASFWFPWHDCQSMTTRIFVSNPSREMAIVAVYVGGEKRGVHQILAGETLPIDIQNISGGPMYAISTNGVPVMVLQRFGYGNALTDVSGITSQALNSAYWFSPLEMSKQTWLILSAVTDF